MGISDLFQRLSLRTSLYVRCKTALRVFYEMRNVYLVLRYCGVNADDELC